MSEIQFNIQQEFREKQEKYVYYLIAISVSAIGFSVYNTQKHELNTSLIPLAFAVTSWSVSIFFGLKFLKYVISILYANSGYFDIIEGRHPDLGNNPELIKAGLKGYKEALEINCKRMGRYFAWQGYLFYLGIVMFLIWHIFEMYLRTSCYSSFR